MIISEQAQEIAGKWSKEQTQPLQLELSAADHPCTTELREFCQWLAGACELVKVSETRATGEDSPAITFRQGSIIYRAVPTGTELQPFLEALAGNGINTGPFRAASLQIYVAAACPHCPTAVRALTPLIAPDGPLTLEVIDSEACSDLAETDRIKSVPTLILDRTFRWTGSIRPGDLEAMLAPGDRTKIDSGILERLLEGGNAGPLTELMIEAKEASPAICDLLAAEAMSIRLGAMMVIEELLERSPALVEQLIPTLQDKFTAAPEPAQGDILYILGEAGPSTMVKQIETLLSKDLHPEVKEAAREALERLAERHGPATK